jgi:hypothetical protein
MVHIEVFRFDDPVPKDTIQCPKCRAISGDAWTQCEGSCPMTMSPHFNAECAYAFLPYVEGKFDEQEQQ